MSFFSKCLNSLIYRHVKRICIFFLCAGDDFSAFLWRLIAGVECPEGFCFCKSGCELRNSLGYLGIWKFAGYL
jgi:hypothetical protein